MNQTTLPTLSALAHGLGRRITKNVPLVHSDQTIGQVQQQLLRHTKHFNTINYIYVVSKSNKLKGVLSIRELLDHDPDVFIRDVMNQKLVYEHPEQDPEKIARLALRHGLKAIPILNNQKQLLGVIPSDHILQILQHEWEEDLERMTGIIPHELSHDSPLENSIFHNVKHRAPWVIVGLFGGLLTAHIIGSFDEILKKYIVVTTFIPLIAYLANAVGTQTQTLFIRDKAVHSQIYFTKYLLQQLLIGACIGILCGTIITVLSGLIWGSFYLGYAVSLAVLLSILIATLLALVIPEMLSRLKIDPALGSGPFATTIQDVLSVVIYFIVLSFFLQN